MVRRRLRRLDIDQKLELRQLLDESRLTARVRSFRGLTQRHKPLANVTTATISMSARKVMVPRPITASCVSSLTRNMTSMKASATNQKSTQANAKKRMTWAAAAIVRNTGTDLGPSSGTPL